MTVGITRRRNLPSALTAGLIACLALVGAGRAQAAGALYISGAGNGHGIGMSQYGALGYADHGWLYPAILAHYYTGTALERTNPDRDVTVLLSVGSASFSGATDASSGLSSATSATTGSSGTTSTASTTGAAGVGANSDPTAAAPKRLSPRTTYMVIARSSRVLELKAGGHSIGSFQAPLVVTAGHPMTVRGLGPYRGSLVFWPTAGRRVETVNLVDLEDYVRGVISGEMPSSWPAQALDAQAIAARTLAITAPARSARFDLYSDTRSQVYRGVAAETPSTDAAVLATADQVVSYDGRPVLTYFSASSGGHTESIQDAWPGATPEPWLVGVPDPYDDATVDPFYRWAVTLTVPRAAAELGRLVKGALIGIQVTKRGLSPRVVTAEVVGTDGITDVTGPQLEAQLHLRSTYLTFATISASNGSEHADTPPSGAASRRGSTAANTYAIHGTVFPAPPGSTVRIERFVRGGFATAATAAIGAHDDFSVSLRAGGDYRVLDHGIVGPTVTVTARR